MTFHKTDRTSPVDWTAAPACPFESFDARMQLKWRGSPYWHVVAHCRHVGLYVPNAKVCTWVARVMTLDRRYIQRRIGSALQGDPAAISYSEALSRAIDWFQSERIQAVAQGTRPISRTESLNFCPIGPEYSVGSALSDYASWSKLVRSPGSHYNNLVLINYHLANPVLFVPLENFTAQYMKEIASRIVATHGERSRVRKGAADQQSDQHRRAKRTFNSIVTILRMAFQHAWDNGYISSDQPMRCLHRIAVTPAARALFLDRRECLSLVENCTPALAKLVLAGLYSGCRVGELAQLRVEDVGREVFGIHVSAFKSGPARFVFLPDEAMAFFLACCEEKKPGDRVLLSDKGHVWKRQHSNLFRRAVGKAGLPADFSFHGLRHTYASDLVRNGVPLTLVARQLGHSDSRAVAATYGHLAEHFREDQIRRRFSPLSAEYQREAERRTASLQDLWKSVHGRDWRAYGSGLEPPSKPSRSFVRTPVTVLEAFGSS